MSRIDECIKEYRDWCAKLGIVTVSDVNRLVKSGKTNWLINVSETWHEQKIAEIAHNIKRDIEKKKIILISGPSSSGKTTFAIRLQLHLKVLGINAVSISLDNYYKKFCDMPLNESGNPDFEALEAIDYHLFNRNVKELIEGKEVYLPIYNFKTSERIIDGQRLKLANDEVIIVEGIHGLNPRLAENIPDDGKYKIYCSALMALFHDDGVRIKSRSNRLIRRLVRDYYFRKSSYEETLDLWPFVEKGSEDNIFPYTDTADIIFNSSLLYELCVYKKYLHEIVGEITADNKYYEQLMQLYEIVDAFEDIDSEDTPKISLVREFVGGNTLYT